MAPEKDKLKKKPAEIDELSGLPYQPKPIISPLYFKDVDDVEYEVPHNLYSRDSLLNLNHRVATRFDEMLNLMQLMYDRVDKLYVEVFGKSIEEDEFVAPPDEVIL